MTSMARQAIKNAQSSGADHTGLMLDRYLRSWPQDSSQKGEAIQALIDEACRVPVSDTYRRAYERWRQIVTGDITHFAIWFGDLDGRLYLGTGEPSSIEASVTLHHNYGVPMIPGSAIKGMTRAYAMAQGLKDEQQAVFEVLFGRDPSVDNEGKVDTGDAGYLLFHNAWWVPDSAPHPLVPEIITVHHKDYYTSQGKTPATDFDSPTPNPQIAIQGGFLFAIEGPGTWPAFAMELMSHALQDYGIGGKTSAGYGFFTPNCDENLKDAAPEVKARVVIGRWTPDELATAVGKNWKKTKDQLGVEEDTLVAIIREQHGALIESWRDSLRSNEKKTFKRLYNRGQ